MRSVGWSVSGLLWLTSLAGSGAEPRCEQRVAQVAETEGLVAFWDFQLEKDGLWTSYHDPGVVDGGYPIMLRRIGDPRAYSPQQWPYTDEASALRYDDSGPFGRAVLMNRGYVFAEVARRDFMTFDPDHDRVTVYCNGVATSVRRTDPVAQDVFQYAEPISANPYQFPWPIYSPRAFVLKYNGYHVRTSGVYEHWLRVDTEAGVVTYGRSSPEPAKVHNAFRVVFDIQRDGASLLPAPLVFAAEDGQGAALPDGVRIRVADQIVTSLETHAGDAWQRVGTEVRYPVREGAPFTFGRALGLGTEPIDRGSQLLLDGVAVFNRLLTDAELQSLSFCAAAVESAGC